MWNRFVSGSLLTLLLIGVLALSFNIRSVKANGTVYIKADGSVDPPTAPIRRYVDSYTLTGNISGGLYVGRDNVIIDGDGYMIQGETVGAGTGIEFSGRKNVTVSNVQVSGFFSGIEASFCSNCNISKNNVTKNRWGLHLVVSSNNSILGNSITANVEYGIISAGSSNNTIVGNIITDNGQIGILLTALYTISITSFSYDNIVSKNQITKNEYGIVLTCASNNSVTTNNITSNEYGIRLGGEPRSSDNHIAWNTIANNRYGMYILSAPRNSIVENNISANNWGIWLDTSSNIYIIGNNVTASTYQSILANCSSNNNIVGNNVINNGVGMWFYQSSNNVISENSMINNTWYGIFLRYSPYNRIFHNNFVENLQLALFIGSFGNLWDNGYSGGNFWSDYAGIDSDQNGIGDSPFVIDPYNKEANDTDNYPLMGMFSSFNTSLGYPVNIVSNSRTEDFEYFKTNYTIKINFSEINLNQTVGFCRAGIPHALMSEPYNITVDSTSPTFCNSTVYDDGTQRWIYFTYQYSTHEVVVQGFEPDITPPTISIISPENKTYNVSNITLTLTVSEAPRWISYSLNGQVNVTFSGNITLSGLPEGSHSLIIYSSDRTGNLAASETIHFGINTQQSPFLIWIAAAIAGTTTVGIALTVYLIKRRKS